MKKIWNEWEEEWEEENKENNNDILFEERILLKIKGCGYDDMDWNGIN
jgi:hypothetical protein